MIVDGNSLDVNGNIADRSARMHTGMPAGKLEMSDLEYLDLGDRDLLHVEIDLQRSEARISFTGAEFTEHSPATGGSSRIELKEPVLVMSGFRAVVTTPTSARPETIVLQWSFETGPAGAVAEFLVVGDPEPVKLRFEGARLHLDVGVQSKLQQSEGSPTDNTPDRG